MGTVRWCRGRKAKLSCRSSTGGITNVEPLGRPDIARSWSVRQTLQSRAGVEPSTTLAMFPMKRDVTFPRNLSDTRFTTSCTENLLTKARVLRIPRSLVQTNNGDALAIRNKSSQSTPTSGSFGDGVCIICTESRANATFVHGSTGHTACCVECAEQMCTQGGTCPICRQGFTAVIRNFTV